MKRIEIATEIVTDGSDSVIRVIRKDVVNIPRNFSFAALGKRAQDVASAPARVTPASFKLFIEDYHVKSGSFADLYESAWRAYSNTSKLELSFIIC